MKFRRNRGCANWSSVRGQHCHQLTGKYNAPSFYPADIGIVEVPPKVVIGVEPFVSNVDTIISSFKFGNFFNFAQNLSDLLLIEHFSMLRFSVRVVCHWWLSKVPVRTGLMDVLVVVSKAISVTRCYLI